MVGPGGMKAAVVGAVEAGAAVVGAVFCVCSGPMVFDRSGSWALTLFSQRPWT